MTYTRLYGALVSSHVLRVLRPTSHFQHGIPALHCRHALVSLSSLAVGESNTPTFSHKNVIRFTRAFLGFTRGLEVISLSMCF